MPLITPGASLPAAPGEKPFTIKVGKIRGVESQGMMCSPKELGLAEDASGLMILPAEAQVGQPLAEHLGRDKSDVVYDLEVTPNRPDLNSVIGIAREVAALFGVEMSPPVISLKETGPQVETLSSITIEDPDLCPRYAARIVQNVTIKPSPLWLRQRLEGGGQAYVVFPLIDESRHLEAGSIAALGRDVAERLGGLSTAVLHGRTPVEERERLMRAFAGGEIAALIATTVTEVGVDVPAATVMIIESAERFGLAQLHQLRGRGGRGGCALPSGGERGVGGTDRSTRSAVAGAQGARGPRERAARARPVKGAPDRDRRRPHRGGSAAQSLRAAA